MPRFKHLNVPQHWETYWSKYPNGYTILEALIQWVQQVDNMVDNQNGLNQNVEAFRTELDEFIGNFDGRLDKEVTDLLTDWQGSGFLDVVISKALQTEMDNLDNQMVKTNEELARLDIAKANLSDIGSPTQSQVDTWLSNNPQATTTVGDYSLETKKHAYKTITPNRTTFIKASSNLANSEDMRSGFTISQTNGNAVELPGYFMSQYIPLKGGLSYIASGIHRLALYNEDDVLILAQHGAHIFEMPVDGYMRYSTSDPDSVQINEGTTLLNYEKSTNHSLRDDIAIGIPRDPARYNLPLKTKPAVALTFDDGNLSDYTVAFPELQSRGMRGVFGVVPGSWVGTGGMATAEQLKEMSDGGMNIISHSHTHPDFHTLNKEQAIEQFKNSKNAIEQITGRPCDTMLVPYNNWNSNLEKWVSPFFDYVRVRGDTLNVYGTSFSPHNLKSFGVTAQTTVQEVKNMINLAIETGGVIVLMFHKIMPAPAESFHWDIPRFQEILDYIDSVDIDVVDLKQAANLLQANQNSMSPNLVVNPKFKTTENGKFDPWEIEVNGEGTTISVVNDQLVFNKVDKTIYLSNVRNNTFNVEKDATYQFTCDVEIENASFGTGTHGVAIREQISTYQSEYLTENGKHQLSFTFVTTTRNARPELRVLRGSGLFKFSNPVIKRIK